jgi:hypothetical protein
MSILTSNMGTKLVIFLAFTTIALFFNAFILWFGYKALTRTSTKMAEVIHELQASEGTREWLKSLESASLQAVTLTDTAKTKLDTFDPVLARAHSRLGFRLAQVDIHFERGVATVLDKADRFQNAISGPANRLSATLHGIHEVVQYLSGQRSTEEADSTQKR